MTSINTAAWRGEKSRDNQKKAGRKEQEAIDILEYGALEWCAPGENRLDKELLPLWDVIGIPHFLGITGLCHCGMLRFTEEIE
jgi:hypothetical protein